MISVGTSPYSPEAEELLSHLENINYNLKDPYIADILPPLKVLVRLMVAVLAVLVDPEHQDDNTYRRAVASARAIIRTTPPTMEEIRSGK